MTYDFFLPGLILDAIESANGEVLESWAKELLDKKIRVVNMLGCHDGIPLLDIKGMIPEGRIQNLIDTVVNRGGFVKNLHGQKNIYYQVNATYYSALGEEDRKMLLARALQIFMPGKPQVWYLDLFAGKNDYEVVERAGTGGHKEINRTNLTMEAVAEKLQLDVVQKQIRMLNFRNTFPAFDFDAELKVSSQKNKINFEWTHLGNKALLSVDFENFVFIMRGIDENENEVFMLQN